jgi:hypothetical protein
MIDAHAGCVWVCGWGRQYKDRWVFEFFKFDFLVDPKACEAMGEKVHKSGDPMIVANGDGGWTGRAGPSLSSVRHLTYLNVDDRG